MAACASGSEVKAVFVSRIIRVALCEAEVVPEPVDAFFAAVTVALNTLKKFPAALVMSFAAAVVDSVANACATVWPAEIADFKSPKDESCAVVASTSDWMRLSAFSSDGGTELTAEAA